MHHACASFGELWWYMELTHEGLLGQFCSKPLDCILRQQTWSPCSIWSVQPLISVVGGGFPCWWLTVVQAEGIPLSLLSLCTLIASDCACLTVLLVDALLIRVRFLKRIDAESMFTFCGRLAPEAHM